MSGQVEQDPREATEQQASTEVAVQQQYREPANELEQFAMDLGTAYRAARSLVTTSFVPKTYSGKPEEAAAAIMTGQEVGLSPLAALRSIDIINGVPAMRAVALRALVQAEGHEIWTAESTATRAVVKGRRKGSDNVEESVWTMERARGLALVGKDNWKKQPIAMLLARATSELVRLIAADVILGIPYSTEEIEDSAGVVSEEAPKKPSSTRTAKRQQLPAPTPAPEPPLPGEEPQPEVDLDEPLADPELVQDAEAEVVEAENAVEDARASLARRAQEANERRARERAAGKPEGALGERTVTWTEGQDGPPGEEPPLDWDERNGQ